MEGEKDLSSPNDYQLLLFIAFYFFVSFSSIGDIPLPF